MDPERQAGEAYSPKSSTEEAQFFADPARPHEFMASLRWPGGSRARWRRSRRSGSAEGVPTRGLDQWTFNLATAVSALLCVAVCVLGARSYWVSDDVRIPLSRRMRGVECLYLVTGKGGIGVGAMSSRSGAAKWFRYPARTYGNGGLRAMRAADRLGFDAGIIRTSVSITYGAIAPAWFLAPATAALPTVWAWRLRRHRFVEP